MALCAGCGRYAFDPLGGDAGSDGDGAVDMAPDTGDAARTDWWDPAWKRRIKLTFDNVGPALSGFPVMVRLDATRIDYTATQNLGQDLRFVDADDTTVLPHDVEVWNELGASIIWVRVPVIDATSSSDFMWLYFDHPTAAAGANPAAVWAGHALVWHFGEPPTGVPPQIIDRSGNGNHGATAGGIPAAAQTTGQIGGALAFDGTDDWVAAPGSASLAIAGSLTISMWVRLDAQRSQWLCDFVQPQSEQEVNNHLYELSIDSGDNVELHWEYGAGNDESVQSSADLAAPLGTWVMIAVTRDPATAGVRFYKNGSPLGSVQGYANDATGGTAASLFVGGEDDSSSSKSTLRGQQDELRISPVVRSDGYIAADYRSTTDQMLLYGTPEPY